MTWNLCPIVVTDADYDPVRHEMPIAKTAIHEGELVGIIEQNTEMPHLWVESLENSDNPWIFHLVGIAAVSAEKGAPAKVLAGRRGNAFWVWKFGVKPEFDPNESLVLDKAQLETAILKEIERYLPMLVQRAFREMTASVMTKASQ